MPMLPKDMRFSDGRTDRHHYSPIDRRLQKKQRKRFAKQFSKQLIDWRLDRRFALPLLYESVMASNDWEHRMVFAASRFIDHFNCGRWQKDKHIEYPLYETTAAHRALKDKTQVACYPTRRDAERGREVVMTAGRFFAGTTAYKSASEVQKMAEKFVLATNAPKLQFATEPNDWVTVYSNGRGFSSCMDGSKFGWNNHPVRFYAYPDNGLALAYITMPGEPDVVVARSIVNQERKQYVRVYGDARLKEILEGAGYKHDSFAALQHVKCWAKPDGDSGRRLRAPYLDGVGRIDWDRKSEYCTIDDDGEYDAEDANGFACLEGSNYTCGYCEDNYDEDDVEYTEYHDEYICDSCASNYYTRAIINVHGTRALVRDTDDGLINMPDGESYIATDAVCDKYDLVCDIDGDWQYRDDCIFLHYCGEYVRVEDCIRLDIEHETRYGQDEYAASNDTMEFVHRGKTYVVHEDFDKDQFLADFIFARTQARARARQRMRTFSRGPGRRARTLSLRRQRYFQKALMR